MRPYRTTYRFDKLRGEWRDARLFAEDVKGQSATVDPLMKGRWYRNFTKTPIWVDSRSQLKALCRQHGVVLTG